ncbi:MAG: alpha/beta fold hydrolase [Flavobacteriales bacterium]
MTPHFCTYNGKKIRYYTEGAGPVVVLLHGFLESSYIWRYFSKQLSQGFKIISIDLPGHGATEVFAEVHTMPLMADVVVAVLKQEKEKKAKVLGHSMGGYVALSFGERYAEYCEGIGLINSTAFPDTVEKKADRLRAIRVLEMSPVVFIREAIPNLFAPFNVARFSEEIELLRAEALKTSVFGASACLRGMKDREDKTEIIRSGKFPVLFVAGKYDNVIAANLSVEQMELHPSVSGLLLENSGHMSFLEEREKTLEAIREFVG